jgi:hypothetical protein
MKSLAFHPRLVGPSDPCPVLSDHAEAGGWRQGDLTYVTLEVSDTTRFRPFFSTVAGWEFVAGRVAAGRWTTWPRCAASTAAMKFVEPFTWACHPRPTNQSVRLNRPRRSAKRAKARVLPQEIERVREAGYPKDLRGAFAEDR